MKTNISPSLALLPLSIWLVGCPDGPKNGDDTGSYDIDNLAHDFDGDGFTENEGDCNDDDAAVSPGATEICDAVDNNCDGEVDEDDAEDAVTWYRDADGDGFGNAENTWPACAQPSGYLADSTDCDDLESAINPAGEESCNGLDDDCNGVVDGAEAVDATPWYSDSDGDGFGDAASSLADCEAPSGYVADATDCDDAVTETNPDASESCNGIDDDCDAAVDEDDASDAQTWYTDSDSDGYGDPDASQAACTVPSGMIADGSDCDDFDSAVFPGADEYCNGYDDDCDNSVDEDDAVNRLTWYADTDGDSYGDPNLSSQACNSSFGWVADATDCDDTVDDTNPGALDWCDDGVDNDCDGADETLNVTRMVQESDFDGDGVAEFFAYFTVDADGNSTSAEVDGDGNGSVDYVYYWGYDANGNMTSTDVDFDGDGVGEYVYTYTYDADGNMTSYTFTYYGAIIEAETYVYDTDGNMTDRFVDSDGDGIDDHISTWTYDVDGNLLTEEIDSDGDGTADERTTWFYDTDGNEREEHVDSDADGNIDSSHWKNYDANGDLDNEHYDSDGDGQVDISYTYYRDSNGDPLSADNDTDGDGTTDRQWFWTYDVDGNLVSIDVDSDLDGTTDVTYYEATFDSNGNRTWYAYDSDVDGSWDETYTFTYDSNGNMLSEVEDTNGDGNPEASHTYTADGDTTQSVYDDDSDGTADETHWFLLACDDSY